MGEEELFQCPECGLHYRNKETASRCQAWCSVHHSCNLEIISEAEENKSLKSQETS